MPVTRRQSPNSSSTLAEQTTSNPVPTQDSRISETAQRSLHKKAKTGQSEASAIPFPDTCNSYIAPHPIRIRRFFNYTEYLISEIEKRLQQEKANSLKALPSNSSNPVNQKRDLI